MKLKFQNLLWIWLLLLASCQTAAPISETPSTAELRSTPATPSPAVEATSALPATTAEPPTGFQSDLLRSDIIPVSYIVDACYYLDSRWDPANSAPGTVVAPIMYHSIRPAGEEPVEPSAINLDTFEATIRTALALGFETITSSQLSAFLYENAQIPRRSMLLILDDRKPGTAEEYFLPVLEENHWTATLAWPIGNTDQRRSGGRLPGESLWGWIERLNETGYFDIQSHGLNHIYLNDRFLDDAVRQEIEGSVPILEEHFGQRPIAYIWPGGNYSAFGVKVAREAGFEFGFTVQSHGPILFNWIPQGNRELEIGDPLMLLPRFWSSAAVINLEHAAEIGDAARAFAEQNYPAEAEWYQANCGGELPPLEAVLDQP